MDTMGRYVFESFNAPSPKGHPSEHTRLLYRGNSNKMIDKGILRKGKVGEKQPEAVFRKECGALVLLKTGAETLGLAQSPGMILSVKSLYWGEVV